MVLYFRLGGAPAPEPDFPHRSAHQVQERQADQGGTL